MTDGSTSKNEKTTKTGDRSGSDNTDSNENRRRLPRRQHANGSDDVLSGVGGADSNGKNGDKAAHKNKETDIATSPSLPLTMSPSEPSTRTGSRDSAPDPSPSTSAAQTQPQGQTRATNDLPATSGVRTRSSGTGSASTASTGRTGADTDTAPTSPGDQDGGAENRHHAQRVKNEHVKNGGEHGSGDANTSEAGTATTASSSQQTQQQQQQQQAAPPPPPSYTGLTEGVGVSGAGAGVPGSGANTTRGPPPVITRTSPTTITAPYEHGAGPQQPPPYTPQETQYHPPPPPYTAMPNAHAHGYPPAHSQLPQPLSPYPRPLPQPRQHSYGYGFGPVYGYPSALGQGHGPEPGIQRPLSQPLPLSPSQAQPRRPQPLQLSTTTASVSAGGPPSSAHHNTYTHPAEPPPSGRNEHESHNDGVAALHGPMRRRGSSPPTTASSIGTAAGGEMRLRARDDAADAHAEAPPPHHLNAACAPLSSGAGGPVGAVAGPGPGLKQQPDLICLCTKAPKVPRPRNGKSAVRLSLLLAPSFASSASCLMLLLVFVIVVCFVLYFLFSVFLSPRLVSPTTACKSALRIFLPLAPLSLCQNGRESRGKQPTKLCKNDSLTESHVVEYSIHPIPTGEPGAGGGGAPGAREPGHLEADREAVDIGDGRG